MLIKHIKSKLFTLDYNKETSIKKRVFNLVRCNLVRLVLIGQCIFCIHYLISITRYLSYVGLLVIPLLILLDAVYVSIFRNGEEYKW